MPDWMRATPKLFKAAFDLFNRVKVPRLAAALALYVILSLAPLLLLVVSVVALVFGEQAAQGGLQAQVQDLIGPEGAKAVQDMLKKDDKPGGILSTVLSSVMLVVGATGVFASLQDSLNAVWEIPEQKSKGLGLWKMLRDRLLSFSAVAGMAFLLLVSLAANALLSLLSGWVQRVTGLADGGFLLHSVNFLLSLVLAVVMFAIVFKLLPDRKVGWRPAVIGATFTAVLFDIGKYLIGLYLGTAAVGSSFGAAGSLVVLLVWVYYSSHIVLFGAAFTRTVSEYRPPEAVTREQQAAAVAAAAD